MSYNRDRDLEWMSRCLELAKQARGRTAPNPMVGCVIVKDGELIGEGFHPAAGQPHAEVFAIAAAQENRGTDAMQGATLYVSLEPCNHFGRTPPCTEAIIQAGISHVVVGMVDPDPRVSGSGCDRLRQAGIIVTVGIAEAACQELNEAFIYRVTHQKPFGILKYAMTLDGKIATSTGHSYWITSEPARHEVHYLRAGCDAIVTGGNTVRHDNPHLTTHGITEYSPLRVVMSRSLDLPTEANLWQVSDIQRTLVITQTDHKQNLADKLRDRGVEVLAISELTPDRVMAELGDRGCNAVLWECGGVLAASVIAADAVQKVYAFIAPKLIGGFDAPSPVGTLGYTEMTQALRLQRTKIITFGEDLLVIGYLDAKD
jgi:diaminohydroxyphosphoribosylaminopyrimidine deaminase / 5-amino-6-(5-phosphoribosylamino)uracil reductase